MNDRGSTFVPNSVIRGGEGKPPPLDRLVYIALLAHADANYTCFPSIKTLAAEVDLGVRTVLRAIARLDELDWLDVQPHAAPGGHANRYLLKVRPLRPTGTGPPPDTGPPLRHTGTGKPPPYASYARNGASYAPGDAPQADARVPNRHANETQLNRTQELNPLTRGSTHMKEPSPNRIETSTEELEEGFRAKRALQAANHAARLRVSGLAT